MPYPRTKWVSFYSVIRNLVKKNDPDIRIGEKELVRRYFDQQVELGVKEILAHLPKKPRTGELSHKRVQEEDLASFQSDNPTLEPAWIYSSKVWDLFTKMYPAIQLGDKVKAIILTYLDKRVEKGAQDLVNRLKDPRAGIPHSLINKNDLIDVKFPDDHGTDDDVAAFIKKLEREGQDWAEPPAASPQPSIGSPLTLINTIYFVIIKQGQSSEEIPFPVSPALEVSEVLQDVEKKNGLDPTRVVVKTSGGKPVAHSFFQGTIGELVRGTKSNKFILEIQD